MSYLPVGHRPTAGEIDEFDECDPSHYAGGYDIDLTYGRSLPPSYETCYPIKTSASYHPQFASHSKPGFPASEDGRVYGGAKPNYGFQPGGGRNEYTRPEPGYSMKPPISNFGSSCGRSFDYENPSLMHDKPGRNPDYGESGNGPGGTKPVSDFGCSGYSGWPEKPTYPISSYPEPSYPIPSYPEPSYPIPSYPEPRYPIPSYPEPSSYPEASYPRPRYQEPSYPRPSYPEPSYPRPSYPMPSYPTPGYGPQIHERDNSDYEERKHHHSHSRGHHYRRQ